MQKFIRFQMETVRFGTLYSFMAYADPLCKGNTVGGVPHNAGIRQVPWTANRGIWQAHCNDYPD